DGVLLEEEIDSSLGFLRYDYPEAVYSELRKLFRQALYEQQNLSEMAQKLAVQLSADRKIMLGVQLYDLISQAGQKQDQVVAFCRIYPGQRILVGDQVLTYQDLATYFNAKKNVSMPQIFVRVNRDADEVELERSRTRESSLEVTFGLKVRVKALRDVKASLN